MWTDKSSFLLYFLEVHLIGCKRAAVCVIIVKLKRGCTMRAKLFTRFPSWCRLKGSWWRRRVYSCCSVKYIAEFIRNVYESVNSITVVYVIFYLFVPMLQLSFSSLRLNLWMILLAWITSTCGAHFNTLMTRV